MHTYIHIYIYLYINTVCALLTSQPLTLCFSVCIALTPSRIAGLHKVAGHNLDLPIWLGSLGTAEDVHQKYPVKLTLPLGHIYQIHAFC